MDKIVISGIDAYDGSYDIDLSILSSEDFHTIKRLSGVRLGEMEEASQAGDSDLIIAFAVIALQRHGKPVIEDLLWKAQVGKIQFVPEKTEADPVEGSPLTPPALPSTDGVKSESDSQSSETTSESSETTP